MSVRIRDALGVNPDHSHYLPSAVLPSNNLVGIEVELENIRLVDANQPLKYWKIEHDGSLRNNGVEFVLSHPTCGQTLMDSLVELGLFLDQHEPEASDRTSLHVHLDFRSSTLDQTFQFCMMYAILERTLIKYSGGKSRADSIYCIPLYKSYETLRCMSRLNEKSILKYVTSAIQAKNTIRNECQSSVQSSEKYAACNIKPLGSFGSIEVRTHKGEKDPERILEWVQILLALKLYTDTVEIDFDDMFSSMSSKGCSGILHAVFGNGTSLDLLTAQDNLEEDLASGLRVAQDMLHMWEMNTRRHSVPDNARFDCDTDKVHPLLKVKPARKARKRATKSKLFVPVEIVEPPHPLPVLGGDAIQEAIHDARVRLGVALDEDIDDEEF